MAASLLDRRARMAYVEVVKTTFAGFHQDGAGEWVAELACGHRRHVRHQPPWELRPWVLTEEGRAAMLGQSLDCSLCDAVVLPPSAREYKRTATFTDLTLPKALREDHRTKPGTWARIVVEAGRAEYHVRGRVQILEPGAVGIVEPEVPHHLVPLGPLSVHVEFLRVE
jgi:tellurite methyltransferase